MTIASLLLILFGYLFGSISTAVLVSKAFGLPDPRSSGSGNPGATNVLRLGGKKAAALTLLGDSIKGAIPVWLALFLGAEGLVLAGVALAAFLGHLYPVFFGFKGGKGVATALGVLLGLSPLLAGALLLTWVIVFAVTRISSLSALTAAGCAPLVGLWLLPDWYVRIAVFIITGLLFIRHHENISRLIRGEESSFKKTPS